MNKAFDAYLKTELSNLKQQGLYKEERTITSQQSASIDTTEAPEVLNFCANNYLGLANHPQLISAGVEGLQTYGYGLASVRFICGTQTVHKTLEKSLADFLGFEDAILYSSCFDANGGLFETLFNAEDVIISDELNHASIIDGIRLCKAQRRRYKNNDLIDLEQQLKEAQSQSPRFIAIVSDGVFSMDGIIANLKGICDLAEKYQAMVIVDDSHAVGFLGENGRGSHEYCEVMGRVDIMTGTLGKALGGASGGYTVASSAIVDWLRNRSRPYLFSNTLAPAIANGSLKALELIQAGGELRQKLQDNSAYFRRKMTALGFEMIEGDHPIIPVMLGDAQLAKTFADRMLAEGVYVIGFSFPVVPKGKARIRTQMSAAHSKEHLDKAIAAFAKVGRSLGVI